MPEKMWGPILIGASVLFFLLSWHAFVVREDAGVIFGLAIMNPAYQPEPGSGGLEALTARFHRGQTFFTLIAYGSLAIGATLGIGAIVRGCRWLRREPVAA